MNKRIKIIISILIIGIILLGGIIYKLKFNDMSVIGYSIVYFDDMDPGSKSNIKISKNEVEIITTTSCSALDCDTKHQKEVFNYSNVNIEKLINFIDNNFSTNNVEVHDDELTDYQKDVIQGLLLNEYFFEINVEEYKYKVEYRKNDNEVYYIYLKNDSSILVKKATINNNYEFFGVDTYSLDFSSEKLKIIGDYIKKEADYKKTNILYKSAFLKKDEVNIFNSIVNRNESYLTNIEKEAKLIYTISYNGINCQTPLLYLYSDNTYEYYDRISFGTEVEKPKIGVYYYDINKIIKNIDKYEKNSAGPYYIKEAYGKTYVTYDTNIDLQDFLKSLNIELTKCVE